MNKAMGILAPGVAALGLAGCGGTDARVPAISPPAATQAGQPNAPAGNAPSTPDVAPPAGVDPTLNLHDKLESHIEAIYGSGGWGFADNSPDALVPFVSIHQRDDHFVYITRGGLAQKFPHEFVLRLRDRAATSGKPTIEVAPMWPVHLLREIVATERRVGKVFAPKDLLGNIVLSGVELPYRSVVFLLDPVVKGLKTESAFVAFVSVVLFSDADYAVMDKIPLGSTNTILKARMEAEPLGLIPAGAP